MFVTTKLQDNVRVEPADLGRPLAEALTACLKRTFIDKAWSSRLWQGTLPCFSASAYWSHKTGCPVSVKSAGCTEEGQFSTSVLQQLLWCRVLALLSVSVLEPTCTPASESGRLVSK